MTPAKPSQNTFIRNTALILLAICFALGCVWRFTPLHDRIGIETMVHWGAQLQGRPWTLWAVIGIYIAGGFLFFFHAALLWATVFTFDPVHAFIYAEIGTLASSMVVYGVGRVLRRDVIARMTGSYMGEVSQALAHKGALNLFLLHVFPICPFSILNLLAGATHIRMKDFILGTVLGATPGIVVLCVFGNSLIQILRHPNGIDMLVFAAFVTVGLWVLSGMRKRLRARIARGQ